MGTLKNGQLKFQFTQFAWTHIALVLIVFQGHFIIYNVFEGMFWFFLPAALVITNDIFAYICGITFGRTQLIKLSPKKTVEGLVGAWVMTVLFGIFLTHFLIKSPYFICPVNNLGATYFSGLQCQPNKVFIPQVYSSPHLLFLPDNWHFSFTMAPVQIHTFFWATFASLVAPFGGFFASGIKRTFKIKDFGDSIPGHGGITDRMDCQFIMGLFAYVYITSFIRYRETSPGAIMEEAIGGLSYDDQFELIGSMIKYLVAHKALGPQVRGKRCLLVWRKMTDMLLSGSGTSSKNRPSAIQERRLRLEGSWTGAWLDSLWGAGVVLDDSRCQTSTLNEQRAMVGRMIKGGMFLLAAGVVGYSYLFYRLPPYMSPESSFLQQRSNAAGGRGGSCGGHVMLRIDRIYMLGRRMDNVGSCIYCATDDGCQSCQYGSFNDERSVLDILDREASLWTDSEFHHHHRVWDKQSPLHHDSPFYVYTRRGQNLENDSFCWPSRILSMKRLSRWR